jgi:fructose-1,6-bisphosphatase/inositol monophosphatase family enzyme
MANPNTIILGQSFKQLNALAKYPFPAISVAIFKLSVLEFAPLAEQHGRAVFSGKKGSESLLKAAPEEQRGAIVPFSPAI